MSFRKKFSDRYNYSPKEVEIKIREDASEDFRAALLHIALDSDLAPSTLREIICGILRKAPDRNNWSEYPNIREEVQNLINDCEWFRVYDITEGIYTFLANRRGYHIAEEFATEINDYFRATGIGWQLVEGIIEVRGTESFESSVRGAVDILAKSGRPTASQEIHESLLDLSRRPEPDLTGSIQHAMAALECVARDVCGDSKATLGELLKRYPSIVPRPLDDALAKVWGYASEMARHIREGRMPDREEAELLVGLSATIATYLAKKSGITI